MSENIDKDKLHRDIVRLYFQNGESASQTVRSYLTEKGLKRHLFGEDKVRRLINKFNDGLLTVKRKEGSGRPRLFPNGDQSLPERLKAVIEAKGDHIEKFSNFS